MPAMKMTLRALGVVLAILGAVWVLQGLGILPGSFMSGDREWAIRGAVALVGGIVLLVLGFRRR